MELSIMKPSDIRGLRENLGFTQAQLADAVGVNRTAVTLWESGMRNPSGSAEKLLAMLFGAAVTGNPQKKTAKSRSGKKS